MGIWSRMSGSVARLRKAAIGRVGSTLKSTSGQGTTEYAILVGVLVVIAIIAIVAFRPNLQALWDAIIDGIGQL